MLEIFFVGSKKQTKNFQKRGWLATFDEIIDFVKLRNQNINILKMDIEGGEFEIISNMDMEYICKYVKEFMLEAHPLGKRVPEEDPMKFRKILGRLEQCFSLFYRHARFFLNDTYMATGPRSKWEMGYKLDLGRYKNQEMDATAFSKKWMPLHLWRVVFCK
jgi:hypothetical protein